MQPNSFVQHLLSNVTLNSSRVLELVQSATNDCTDAVLRIMSYLSNYTDLPEVPKTSKVADQATLISYNFFKDEVRYQYLVSRTFKVDEKFLELNNQLFEDYYKIPSEVRCGTGTQSITVTYWDNDRCPLERWTK